jgi:arylsulfatase A-like enzyme
MSCFPLVLAILLAVILRGGAAERPPNLIFILADDLGYGELGCFGSKLIQTPNLDRMAAEGMKFTRFYAGSPVCAPSRSVLMTGAHTGHTRVRGNAGKANIQAQNLRADDLIVPEILKKAGYSTALIGKWGIGHTGSDGLPNKKGFDYFYGYLDQLHAHNPYPDFIMRNEEVVKLRNKIIPGTSGRAKEDEAGLVGAGIAEQPLDYVPDLMASEALKWVRDQKNVPFFLFWSLISPHANNEGRKHGRGQEVPDLEPYGGKYWPIPDKAHAASIARLDADIGRLFALLKELGIDGETLVIFSSDNGHHKEGGNNPDSFDANGPFRGLKRDLYEGGIRVPTIARWPGKVRAGEEVKTAYWFADILPTFSEMAGVPNGSPAKTLDGLSFAQLLQNRPFTPGRRNPFYWEFHEGGFSQAVIMDDRWKAIRLKRRDAPVQIYDLENDAGEEKDLASERLDLVKRAKQLFESERAESEDWPIKDAPIKGAKDDGAEK